MAPSNDWLPSRLADQAVVFQNVDKKIDGYTTVLPLTPAQVTRIKLICQIFGNVYNFVEQSRASVTSLVEWRDLILKGQPEGDPAPAPPTMPPYDPVLNSFIGIIGEFRDLVDLIKKLPGYTRAIGEDLMIVAPEKEKAVEDSVTPDIKVKTGAGYEITVSGAMQGMDAMRVEYQRNGASAWSLAAFLTKTPGSFHVAPQTPGEPETGRIRVIYILKNQEYGNWSPEFPVTLS